MHRTVFHQIYISVFSEAYVVPSFQLVLLNLLSHEGGLTKATLRIMSLATMSSCPWNQMMQLCASDRRETQLDTEAQ